MEVLSLIIYTKYFWDFDMWPFNRVWPLNGEPLNGGSTVLYLCVNSHVQAQPFIRDWNNWTITIGVHGKCHGHCRIRTHILA